MSFARLGYAVSSLVITAESCDAIVNELPSSESRRGGVRHLLQSGVVRRMLADPKVAHAIGEHVDEPLVAVKATLFDKTPSANWLVQWHQDRVVALAEQRDVAGFKRWTKKDGVPHAEAPVVLLQQMVAVRVHLDPSGPENGPLRVIPGTHLQGMVPEEEIPQIVRAADQVELALPQGSVLLMRPLLLHASAPAVRAEHRRVLHVELAPLSLSGGLRWNESAEVGVA